MRKKFSKKTYFVIAYLVLFILANSVSYHFNQENSLNQVVEDSYQEMILKTKSNMFQEYQSKYGITESEFEYYWEDFEKTDEFRILNLEFQEDYKTNYKELRSSAPAYRRALGFFVGWFINLPVMVLTIIKSPLRLILSAILILIAHYVLKKTYFLIF